MKTFRIAVLIFLAAQAADAFTPRWRWREDDADVFQAAWKDTVNRAIIYRGEGNLRLRKTFVPPDSGAMSVSLRYSSEPYYQSDDSMKWTLVTAADTGKFFLTDSKYFADGTLYPDNALLNVWYDGGGAAYLGTITIDSSSQYPLRVKTFDEGYEFEYCLKPNAAIPEGSVYYFLSFAGEDGLYENDPPCVRFPPLYWDYYQQRSSGIDAVRFIDERHGWYQAYEDAGYVLRRTADGGRTWTLLHAQFSNCPVCFVTRDTGWAVIDRRISKSTDGGAIWTGQEYGADTSVYEPNSLYFLDAMHGWATCATDPMLRTSDGGASWERIRSPAAYLLSSWFVNERVGFTIGESIYKTIDGGTSWRLVQSAYNPESERGMRAAAVDPLRVGCTDFPPSPLTGSFQFVDSSEGWALAYNGKLYHTTDQGEHWELRQLLRSPRALAFHFSNRTTGWIVGERGMILATKDGGVTWEKRPSGTGHHLSTLDGVNDHLWIGSRDGTILSSTSGGWMTTAKAEERTSAAALPEAYMLCQNYPNPFNPATTIRYALPNASQVTLKIFDMLGREVTTLVNERKSAGHYEATWNATRYSSGVYLLQMNAGAFVQTRMMALVK